MLASFRRVILVVSTLCVAEVLATDRYVAQNGQTPASPFTAWTGAASNIQDAVSAASTNDTVWIGSGTYRTPPSPVNFGGSNIVYIDRPITLRSASGNPADTILDGEGTNRGIAIYYGTAGKQFFIDGLTITNCHGYTMGGGIMLTDSVGGYSNPGWTSRVSNCRIINNTVSYGTNLGFQAVGAYGGGIGMYSRQASWLVISNCVLQSNLATNELADPASSGGIGAGLYYGGYSGMAWVMGSLLQRNRAYRGGNAYVGGVTGRFEWCDISGSWALGGAQAFGAGVFLTTSGLFRNCLITGNTSYGGRGAGINHEASSSNVLLEVMSCTIVSNTGGGVYVRGRTLALNGHASLHLLNSVIYSNGTDVIIEGSSDGYPNNFSTYARNCCFWSTSVVNLGTNVLNYAGLSSNNVAGPPLYRDFRNGDFRLWPWSPAVDTGLTEDWMTGATDYAGQPRVSANGLVDMGCYETTAEPHPAAFYAAQNGQTPVAPYTNWMTAASNIQDAIDIASEGDTVLIGAGRYRGPGSGVSYNSVTNIVTLNKPLTLRGAGATRGDVLIDGEGAYRGIHVSYAASTTNRFVVSGLTVTNSNDRGILFYASVAGVIWTGVVDNCAVVNCKIGGINDDVTSPNTSQRTIIITNSLVRGNLGAGITIYFAGGGSFSSVIADSIIEKNTNSGVALHYGTHTLSRCIIRDNTSPATSGGLSLGVGTYTMDNCLLARNTAAGIGGAIYKWSATGPLYMYNCTIVSNLSTVTGPGGIRSAATNPIVNSVIYYNYFNSSSAAGDNVFASGFTTLTNCLAPGASGSGSISFPAPVFENFAGGDYRLCAFSSGVDTGLVLAGMATATDLAGQPRVSGNGLVDMGCYETQSGPHPGYYVAQAGQTPVYPYTNWPMAASNIQDAVDAYSAGYGATIWVGPGRYTATTNAHVRYGTNTVVDIYNKAMTLRGYSGNPGDTIVDGEGKNRCLYFSPGSSIPDAPYVIDGFTFTNGYAASNNLARCAGVYIGNEFLPAAWTARVQNCVITDNRVADTGSSGGSAGGIYSGYIANNNQDFTFVVSNCVVRNNSTNGMYYLGTCTNVHSSWTIVNSRFENNTGCGLVLNGGTHWNAIRNCRFVGNTTYNYGGGANLSVPVDVVNCLFASNQCLAGGLSYNGGGALYLACPTNNARWPWRQGCNLINCTIIDNVTSNTGVAVYQHFADANCLTLINTVVWSNRNSTATGVGNHYLDTGSGADVFWTNCLSTALTGAGNLTNPPPAFENREAGDYRLKHYSSGVDAGVSNWWIDGTVDLAGQPRVSANGLVDMGVYETFYEPHPGYYVAQNGQTPVAPYTNLTMAASNIQDAVNVYDTIYPSTIWVAPATYTLPPNPTVYYGTNIVYIDRPLTLRSISGNPADTILDGQGAYRGIAFVYGVAGKELVVDGLTISNCLGYTLGGGILMHDPVNGYSTPGWTGRVQNCVIVSNTVTYGGALGAYPAAGAYGGGIGVGTRSASTLVMTNCLVSGNFSTNGMEGVNAGGYGGGIYHGSYSGFAAIDHCQIRDNRAYKGGNGQVGNGGGLIQNSVISGGRVGTYGVQSFGGGFYVGAGMTFRNCLMTDNNSWNGRGSAIHCETQGSNGVIAVENCTLAGNLSGGSAIYIRSWAVAQNFSPSLHVVNSVIYSNSGTIDLEALAPPDNYSSYASNCCLASTNTGVMFGTTNLLYYRGYSANNFTNNPRFANFAAGNYRLAFNSPCVNVGMNQGWMAGAQDLDGMPRVMPLNNGTVDMGAYEFPMQGGTSFMIR